MNEWEARVSRLPVFDPSWADETRERWLVLFCDLWRRAKVTETQSAHEEKKA